MRSNLCNKTKTKTKQNKKRSRQQNRIEFFSKHYLGAVVHRRALADVGLEAQLHQLAVLRRRSRLRKRQNQSLPNEQTPKSKQKMRYRNGQSVAVQHAMTRGDVRHAYCR